VCWVLWDIVGQVCLVICTIPGVLLYLTTGNNLTLGANKDNN